jgi:aromatic-L-amino-acid decarboxylase
MSSTSDMDPGDLRRFGHDIADWVADFRENIEELPVLAQVQPGDVKDRLSVRPPAEPDSMDDILRDFRDIIVPGTTHWNHPAFFAYFANSASGPGILGETLTAALNVNAMVWRTGPAATELESVVLDWLRQMLGLPEAFDGHINDTASVGTLVALAAARERVTEGKVRRSGLSAIPPLRLYCSREAHSSVEKAAIVLGVGQDGVRKIEVDDQFRLRPDELRRAIEEDRAAGALPMAVVATVGTTSTTSIDPVPAIADVCDEAGLWLHVDAAYGGAMGIVPEYRHVLDGCERADTFIVNPHKWLLTPMDCSALYCREPESIRQAFSLVPPYLMTPEQGAARSLMDYGPSLGRRFRALKLWMIIRYFGTEGMAERIRRHVDLARTFGQWVEEEPGWEAMAPAPMSTVLYRHHPAGLTDEQELARHNEAILHAVNRTGRVFLSHTVVEGAYCLRLAIGNVGTELEHLETAWSLLREAALSTSG